MKMREFYSLGVVLGFRYDDSPVIAGDGSVATFAKITGRAAPH